MVEPVDGEAVAAVGQHFEMGQHPVGKVGGVQYVGTGNGIPLRGVPSDMA